MLVHLLSLLSRGEGIDVGRAGAMSPSQCVHRSVRHERRSTAGGQNCVRRI
ncbi:hypothetical protein BSIN_2949 [Burkholderia singularis]|uniref:Uncharacterized protein n=1 Tax=Burkholderia singularis TaxID=1503053 RepID=A0A238H400_9BURK|nr:hypothetical protein BSIN_2949 [Burkholderia singularis]